MVLPWIKIFWAMMLCHWESSSQHFIGFWRIVTISQKPLAQQHSCNQSQKIWTSAALLSQPQTSLFIICLLTKWCPTSGIPVTRCDTRNTEYQVNIITFYETSCRFCCNSHQPFNSGTKGLTWNTCYGGWPKTSECPGQADNLAPL
jgi:hypothetical protein